MAETIHKSIIQEGIEIGETRGELKGRICAILALLQIRFGHVPKIVSERLNERTDLIALQSLFEHAAQCDSMDDFADAL